LIDQKQVAPRTCFFYLRAPSPGIDDCRFFLFVPYFLMLV